MHEITCYHLHEMCIFTALQVIMKGISSIIAILGLFVIMTVKVAPAESDGSYKEKIITDINNSKVFY